MSTKNSITVTISERAVLRVYAGLLVLGVFLFASMVHATTPNPGHPWTDIGDGNFQVANTQTGVRTFTFPDSNTTVLATLGSVTSGAVPYGNGTNVLATTTAGTNGFHLALVNGIPTWVATSTLSTISGTLGLTQGGTNANITATNGGIIYSTASAFGVSAAGLSGQILLSGGAAVPTWSTATYPATAGTNGQQLMSNGTNWTAATTSATVSTMPRTPTTGVVLSTALAGSLTVRKVGLFTVTKAITVKQISFNVPAWTAAGVLKICIYDKYGANKLIDVSTASIGATGVVNTAVASVVLPPDDYYIAVGCASGTCTMSLPFYTTAAAIGENSSVPAGKLVYEGTVAHTSGTCNAALGTITAAVSNMVMARLDN